MKKHFALLILILSSGALAESYFSGERVISDGKDSVKQSIIGIKDETKTSTVWKIIRCDLPKHTDCVRYEAAIRQGMDSKWTYQIPAPNGMLIRAEMTKMDNTKNPANYVASWSGPGNKPCCTLEQKTEKDKTTWEAVYVLNGKKTMYTTTFKPISKEEYKKLSASRKPKL